MSAGDSRRNIFGSEQSAINYDTDDGEIQADPAATVAKFEATGGTSDRFTDYLPAHEVPGHGNRSPDCGDEIPRFCADCGHTTHVGSTCYSWECPRCWKGADRKRATTITAKLEALRRYKENSEGAGWQGYKFHHITLSPPDGFALDSDEPLSRTFDLLKEVLGELGADTGVMFYHPWRGKDGDDRGFWKHLLPEGENTDWAETRDELSKSPHFHAVVLAKNVDGGHVTRAVEEQTGWLIKRITKGGDEGDSDVSIFDLNDLARVATYCLSHTGVDTEGGKASAQYRYFGEVHNFTADPHIQREADASVRSVATNTLGLKYDSVACVVEREKLKMKTIERYAEKVNLGAAHGDGEGPALIEEEIEEEVVENCDGRLLEIKNAPAFLDDDEWLRDAEHADQLVAAWEAWRATVDGDPDEEPPD